MLKHEHELSSVNFWLIHPKFAKLTVLLFIIGPLSRSVDVFFAAQFAPDWAVGDIETHEGHS